ncbi:MAG: hypothetical protein GX289_07305 [Tissierellia bacterium]|jgi:tartrate dehydratase alpha subunit/fumarate hydratase class I-like protein|nr:hypothetical protein [Tissierellia bacterium]
MALDIKINLHPEKAAELINHGIVEGSITGVLIDNYVVHGDDGKVHCVSGGGGEGPFRFDWGASESFEYCVENTLAQYKI